MKLRYKLTIISLTIYLFWFLGIIQGREEAGLQYRESYIRTVQTCNGYRK